MQACVLGSAAPACLPACRSSETSFCHIHFAINASFQPCANVELCFYSGRESEEDSNVMTHTNWLGTNLDASQLQALLHNRVEMS